MVYSGQAVGSTKPINYLSQVPQEYWGSSSKKYGQVSESGEVEKTPEDLAREAQTRVSGRSTKLIGIDQIKESVEGFGKAIEQGKELFGKLKYQAGEYLQNYLKWKKEQAKPSEPAEGTVSGNEAFKLIEQAEAEGRITPEEATQYREDVASQLAEQSVKGRAESAGYIVPERVMSAMASTLTPEAVGTSIFVGAGGAIIGKGSSVAISSGVPALMVSGALLKGGIIALSGVQFIKTFNEFKTLEAPEQLGVVLGSLPLIYVGAQSYKFTSGILDLIPTKQTRIGEDFKAIESVNKKQALVTTEQEQTIIIIPKTQRGVEGINYEVNTFELTQPSSSTLLVDKSVPTGLFKVGSYGGKTVEITSDFGTGMTVAKIFEGTSPDVRAYAFTSTGKVYGFDVSTASWFNPTIKALFYEGAFKGGVESVVVAPIASYSEQSGKVIDVPVSYKGAGLISGGDNAGIVMFEPSRMRFSEGNPEIIYKTKYFRSGSSEVFGGSFPPTLRLKQEIFTEFGAYPAGTTTTTSVTPKIMALSLTSGLEGLPDFKTAPSSRPPLLNQLYGGQTTVQSSLALTGSVEVGIPKIDVPSASTVNVASPVGMSSLSQTGSGVVELGEVASGVLSGTASKNEVGYGFKTESATKSALLMVETPLFAEKLKTGVLTKTKSAFKSAVKVEQKVALKQDSKLSLALVAVQVPAVKVKTTAVTTQALVPTLGRANFGRLPRAPVFGMGFGHRAGSPIFRVSGRREGLSGGRAVRKTNALLVTRSPNIVLFKGSRGIPKQSQRLEGRFLKTAIKTPASYSFDPFARRKK